MNIKNIIKPTQLTRVGYAYQDLICIRLLVEWFHNPDKYQWVCIEGSKNENGKFKGLDDVIALDKNGLYELTQVKFTIDSERDDLKLSFNWLLDKTSHGTSMLQKWQYDVEKYNANGSLSIATLQTNRKPDNEITKCIYNKKINIDQIPIEYIEEIKSQLGGYERSRNFFEIFTFDHSQPEIDNLHNILYNSIVPDHSTPEGWYRFLNVVEKWATRKNEPSPDGHITINHIRELFTAGIWRPLSQFFEIPQGYIPPCENFHAEMLHRVQSEGCWIVCGLPGMGKSTYLSYLAEILNEKEIPIVRHHYSLSTQSIIDRISYPNAARSLQSQLQQLFPSRFKVSEFKPEELDIWISTASDASLKLGKKLVIIIDGLDHVARERSEIIQLEHLINRLLPLRDKICLILGTQSVSDAHLPSKLISDVPKDKRWLPLPLMDLNAIKSWVEELSKNNSIALNGQKEHQTNEIIEVSEALLLASGGYPLHLIYSVKSLMFRGKSLNKYEIEKLPACPDGDINNYYHSLWSNLSQSARIILLLTACVEFPWPDKSSIGFCFDNSLEFEEAFDEIQHLVEKRRSGVFLFHGSILVFLKRRKEFQEQSHELMLKVKKWLLASAPMYWRWGWEWIIEANLANPVPLIRGVNADWSLASFCNGYPLQHIEYIISTAEKFALEHNMIPELVRLRLIKNRIIQPEYQLQQYAEFLKYALYWSSETHTLLWRADNLRILEDKEIAIVASLFRSRDKSVAEECFEEIIRRLKFYARIKDSSQESKIEILINIGIDILVDTENPNINQLLNFLSQIGNNEDFYHIAFDKLITAKQGYYILDIPYLSVPEHSRELFLDYFILVCCQEGISISERPECDKVKTNALGIIAILLEKQPVTMELVPPPSSIPSEEEINTNYFHKKFFFALATQLIELSQVENPKNMIDDEAEDFVKKSIAFFEYAAYCIAKNIKEKIRINVFEIYTYIGHVQLLRKNKYDYNLSSIDICIFHAIVKISLDLYLLLSPSKNIEPLNAACFDEVKNNVWWSSIYWLECATSKAINIVPREVTQRIIQASLTSLSIKKDLTSTLANDSLDLARLAFRLEQREIGVECLTLTAQHTLGYGWRKDTTFSQVYDAISECSDYGVGDIANWLKRVAPFTNDVFDFTEREIRHLPGWFIKLLAKHLPERLVDEFDFHIKNYNWNISHDILVTFVKCFDLNNPVAHALLKCLTSYDSLNELEKRTQKEPILLDIYNDQYHFLGGSPPSPREYTSSPFEEKDIEIELSSYKPNELNLLHEELKNNQKAISADKFFESWISYWADKGHGLDIIASFENLWNDDTDFPYLIRSSLGVIFKLSHKLQGVNKAYNWAVRDICSNSHWNKWMGSRSEEALKKYAGIYSVEWKRLLNDTTAGERIKLRGNEWIVVPTNQLVAYLLAANQPKIACEVTEVMLKSLEKEIAHLPISPLHWYKEPFSKDKIAARLLLLYYKWPDRLARLRTANQIAQLLDSEIFFRPLYLEHLNTLNYEAEITDFLSILLLTESIIYSSEELSTAIQYPSVLSNEILRRIGYKTIRNEFSSFYSDTLIDDYSASDRFEKSKNGIAQIYFSNIDKLSIYFNYPLDKHISAEWDLISTREEFLYFNPYDFCSEQFYSQDKIHCSLSSQPETVLLSAYLRTLSFAHSKLGVPAEIINKYAEYALPFGGTYSKILPSSKPNNWPIIEIISKEDNLPSESNLVEYLSKLAENEEALLCANGPVVRENSGLNADLEVYTIHIENDGIYSPKSLYNFLINHDTSVPIDAHLITSRVFPSDFNRWEFDWLLRGYFAPRFMIGDFPKHTRINTDSVNYFFGNVRNATWKYWTHHWFPASYQSIGSNIGTYLTTSKEILDFIQNKVPGSFYLLGKITILDKRKFDNDNCSINIYGLHKIN